VAARGRAARELPGGHFVRDEMMRRDIDGMIGHLRRA
jgi:hypothetical protein